MKKLLLSILMVSSMAQATILYNAKTKTYYSSKHTSLVDPKEYHKWAMYIYFIFEKINDGSLDAFKGIDGLKLELKENNAIETDLLLEEVTEVLG